MKKVKIISIFILVLLGSTGRGQNQFHMGQYMLHQPFINPAAAGSYENTTAALFHRAQWTGLDGAPSTSGLNLITSLGKNKKIGGTIINDQIGVDRFTHVGLDFAYRLQTGFSSWLSMGVSGYANFVQSNLDQLATVDANDPMFQSSQSYVMPNARFGVYYFRRNFYVGFSVPNLLENKITIAGTEYAPLTVFNVQDIHHYLHAGWAKPLSEDLELNLSGLIKHSPAAPVQFDLNAQVVYKQTFGGGLSYRTSNELLALVNYNIFPNWKLGYAYEYNMGDVGSVSNGSHEIIMIYEFKPPQKTIPSIPRF